MKAFTQIFLASIDDVKNKFSLYLKYLALPFIALVLFEVFEDSFVINLPGVELAPASDKMPAVTLETQSIFSDLIAIIIYVFLEINLAFVTHKVTLNKQSDISIIDGLIWRKKHIPFIKAFFILVGISLLMLIPFILLFFFASLASPEFISEESELNISLFFLTIALPFIYIFSRYSLIAPAAAANKSIKLADSFSLSKGYGWVIATLTFIIPTLFELLLNATPFTLSTILINISLIFSIILLTNCYKHIKT